MKIGVKEVFNNRELGFSLLLLEDKIGHITGTAHINKSDTSILKNPE